ncbi:fluoride efflux transporter CrcB [Marinicella rhabdoformis]|uniref:fluoride efflux transporter CrcB n=1 Tax=Marinicella rhabdoformis TaxID=2580566 RepID=UPI0012AEBE1C|nr:fluoride efflux transporter CrcB [Marinicella rhabdoformis]
MLNAYVLVALGGALGATARYGVNQIVVAIFDKPLVWATLLVNVVGCFFMGLVYSWLQSRPDISATLKPLLMVGFLGALTTWSAFSMETVLLIQNDEWLRALAYTLLTCIFCFTAFWLGLCLKN